MLCILVSTSSLSKEEFEKDRDIQDATVRRIEVIGEAVKKLPDSLRLKYPKIPWRKIAGTRDVIIHTYFKINLEAIWKVVQEDLPELKNNIKEILEKEKKAA